MMLREKCSTTDAEREECGLTLHHPEGVWWIIFDAEASETVQTLQE